ncbi:MAG: nicotinate-nucleotide--dimethylbenzimidazole phosphoribosyltransferase [Planctomycetota bacterium]|jgi:nicotinate-nucleotide--dimethylbenzimidazole phosphoribosyltransferase|nr:nicotinate-nucleotide--dimethylbenzimidazole phosphoribosyltransferase [Planctomycetota bacterium]
MPKTQFPRKFTLKPFDLDAAHRCQEHWDSRGKPPGSLGQLEEALVQIAGITGEAGGALKPCRLLVFCADNGVARRGVSVVGGEVTAALGRSLANGRLAVCQMATVAGVEVTPVDMGVDWERPPAGFIPLSLGRGTADLSQGPAMTPEHALQGIDQGVSVTKAAVEQGARLLLAGEVGIGNTTSAAAMTAVLLGLEVETITGQGAGLPPERIPDKVEIIKQAIRVNHPDPSNPLDVLAKIGGFDLAGLTGMFIACAELGVPVVLDGLISTVAALTAERLCPGARQAMLASHLSTEPAARLVLWELGLEPVVQARLRLGEGSGAVTLVPLLDMARQAYHGMDAYTDLVP